MRRKGPLVEVLSWLRITQPDPFVWMFQFAYGRRRSIDEADPRLRAWILRFLWVISPNQRLKSASARRFRGRVLVDELEPFRRDCRRQRIVTRAEKTGISVLAPSSLPVQPYAVIALLPCPLAAAGDVLALERRCRHFPACRIGSARSSGARQRAAWGVFTSGKLGVLRRT